jgi:predicted nucleic acid-binding protein
MNQKVYIETTIVSYLAARPSKNSIVAGRQALTWEWWKKRRRSFDLVVSELVFQEAADGDSEASIKRLNFLGNIYSLTISDDAVHLAESLTEKGGVPPQFGEDALHIALCAVHGIDYLLTWNCKHLANASRRHKIEEIVENEGSQCPVICTPAELMED